MGEFNKSEADLRKAIALNPQQDLAWANLGLLYSQKENYAEALEFLNKSIEQNSYEIYSLNLRSWVFLQMNNFAEAKEDIDKSLKIEVNNPEGLRNRGLYYFRKNKFQEAIQDLIAAKNAQNDLPWSAYYLGESYFAIKNTKKACEYWQEALKFNKEQAEQKLQKSCQGF